jgi:hypothetical protein
MNKRLHSHKSLGPKQDIHNKKKNEGEMHEKGNDLKKGITSTNH